MRRRVATIFSLALPLVVYSGAYAQPQAAAPPPSSSGAQSGSPSAPQAPSPPSAVAGSPVQPATAPTTSASGAMNGGTYAVRLRDLEQRVDELKDQIRRSHTRLAMLSDTILGGGAAGSRAEISFKDEMSSAFVLTHALFVIDNQVQYNKQDDSGALADQKEIPIYTGSVPPGDHTVQAALTFQGNGYGVFSYLRGYKFEVKSSHSFTAVEGKALSVIATAFEKGGVTTPLEQRPAIEWHESLKPFAPAAAAAAAAAQNGSGAPGSASVSTGISVGGGKK